MEIYPITIPGGSDTEVQYNNGGIFGGAEVYWDDVNKRLNIGTTASMLAPLGITGDAIDISDRHEGIWIRGKTGGFIVQINVRGSRLEIGGGGSLDTAPAMSVNYLTGKVGIGMTPSYILDIDAGEIGDNNYDGLRIVDTGWKAVSHPMLEFYNSNAQFNGSLARIYGEIGNVGTNSKLYFAVADSSKNLQDRMVIDKDGNVGIGIADPIGKFHTSLGVSGVSFSPEFDNCIIENDDHVNLALGVPSGKNAAIAFHDSASRNMGVIGYYHGYNAMAFWTNSTLRFFMDDQGFVGIGSFGISETPDRLVELYHATPYITLHNSTHEDTDGGRESRLNFKGEQGVDPFEETTLARIEVSHDGSGADDKGRIVESVNTGAGLIEARRIDSNLNTFFTKVQLTAIGGIAIKLTNKTGGNTVAGQLVNVYTATAIDDAFKTVSASDENIIGIVLDAGISDGSEAWIVVNGIADVLMDAGGSARGDRIISSATAGSGDAWNVGGAVATHFQEVGHCIETRGGAGLARCVLHFN